MMQRAPGGANNNYRRHAGEDGSLGGSLCQKLPDFVFVIVFIDSSSPGWPRVSRALSLQLAISSSQPPHPLPSSPGPPAGSGSKQSIDRETLSSGLNLILGSIFQKCNVFRKSQAVKVHPRVLDHQN